ncbi:MAG TPA: deoxyribodipyrimidine photo-lyase, partial [Burkholderiaceae bacterium]|nr:deoxyribodipyrimidine photo-lyase [Burkholderiaceae bacterium]
PALAAAIERGRPVVPFFVHDDDEARAGAASRWWLHQSLAALDASLRARGSRLVLRAGSAAEAIDSLLAQTNADAVYWNRRHEPAAAARERAVATELRGRGVDCRSYNASLLAEPWTIRASGGDGYRVFTPFWRALRANDPPAPSQWLPDAIATPDRPLASEPLASPRSGAASGAAEFAGCWTPGEAGALDRLHAFIGSDLARYGQCRDQPAAEATSRLSAHLHFGDIGPRQVWHAAVAAAAEGRAQPSDVERFLSELGWREFAYHLLHQFPNLAEVPVRPEFERFEWIGDAAALRTWQQGLTGYPIVDAGMRQLLQTGWMHNRVRMIAASFLTKHLRIDWRDGQSWFRQRLVDADLANNALGWQWVAGCGADAAPFFRIFNPTLQAERFDADGSYVRRWVPELRALPAPAIHAPWAARPADLAAAGIRLGADYPWPMVDHASARQQALDAYRRMRSGAPAAVRARGAHQGGSA